MTPFTSTVVFLSDTVSEWRNDWQTKNSLEKENAELKAQLTMLQHAQTKITALETENESLSKMLGYKEKYKEQKLLATKVLAANIGALRDTMIIDKGTEDGVASGMLVVSSTGLAGIIEEVYPTTSKFTLVTSPRVKIGAKVLRTESQAVGVITGRGFKDADLKMEYLAREADIVKGDTIVTSGVGERYPTGILIGHVDEITFDDMGLLKIASVESVTKIATLERAFVVLDVK